MTEKESMDNVAETDQAEADTTPLDSDLEDASSQAPLHGNDQATDSEEGTENLSAPPQSLEEKLQAAERQAQENHERFLRAAAELDNFRKRKEREVSDLRKYANQMLLRELLGVVDNLERALAASLENSEPEGLREGVEMTLKELLKIFDQFKVTPIEAHEQPFDPNHHEAVMQEPSDAFPPNTVVKELQKGYMLRDRLLRPAMVVVSK
ncbi:MAG: nucleotide exchange factor GrpE [Desulfobacteraceae bacterium]|nr:nucleotide exchange factor GrpE [Desulfobacteraceae bacterium]MBC2751439.1 nucleotide exchange factor GrpE [Desulfobacteraceae bacterium]